MMRADGQPQAIFGGLLWGDQPVRYIFMDEAGTSEGEPVTVIVGVIASADDHVMMAEAAAREALGAVPSEFRERFVFHAAQVFGDKKYQGGGWSLTDRLRLLEAMMGVPRRVGMSITLAAQWRGAVDQSKVCARMGVSASQADHIQAFGLCVAQADGAIRAHAGPREVATIVAEDVPEMRRFLKAAPRALRDEPIYLPQHLLRRTAADEAAGHVRQNGDNRVTRIRNSVHFVEKAEDPLVQVADACAFGFRRFLAREKFGAEFAKAILGSDDLLRNFAPPGGAECWWHPRDTAHSRVGYG